MLSVQSPHRVGQYYFLFVREMGIRYVVALAAKVVMKLYVAANNNNTRLLCKYVEYKT
jgi:hypothetical protein